MVNNFHHISRKVTGDKLKIKSDRDFETMILIML